MNGFRFSEAEYRQHYLEADRAQWQFALAMFAVPNLIFLAFDYALLGTVPVVMLAVVAITRVALLAFSAWLWFYLKQSRSVRQCDALMIVWGLLGTATIVLNGLSRPVDYFGNYVFEVFIVVAFLAAVPLPLRIQIGLMLVYLAFSFPLLIFLKQPPIPLYTFNVMLVLPVSVVSGCLISQRIHRYRKSALAVRLELERQARTDPLTNILNRRAFMEWSTIEVSRHARSGKPLAVLMLDIDHFKTVNDRYGHAAGDQVLVEFSARVANLLRRHDQFARLGGEEFCVALPECAPEEAFAAAQRICAHLSATPFDAAGQRLPVTVSLGVAQLQAGETVIDAALKRADEALYSAKQAGRNQVAAR